MEQLSKKVLKNNHVKGGIQNNISMINFNKLIKNYWMNRFLILLFIPGLIYFIIFKYLPMYGIIIAFKDYSLSLGYLESPWVGFKHFQRLFSGFEFPIILRNTIVISSLKILFGFPAPIVFAILINEVRSLYFKRIVQTITYLPHFFSWVVLSSMFFIILSPSSGIINKVIQTLGGTPIYFLASKIWFIPVLIITAIWAEVGWGSIVYLAAISGINPEMYEAGIIDGASRFQRILYITLPNIASTIAIMFIFRVGHILNAGFDQIFNLYSPPVYDIADIIDTYLFRVGIGTYQYSFTTAVGLFNSVVGIVLIIITNYISKRVSQNEVGIW